MLAERAHFSLGSRYLCTGNGSLLRAPWWVARGEGLPLLHYLPTPRVIIALIARIPIYGCAIFKPNRPTLQRGAVWFCQGWETATWPARERILSSQFFWEMNTATTTSVGTLAVSNQQSTSRFYSYPFVYWLLLLAAWPHAIGFASAAAPVAAVRQGAPRPYTGRVLNQAHEPLSGATVLVRGTSTVTSTNADGSFLLPLAAGQHTLVVDYPGCRSVVLPVVRPDSALVVIMASTLAPKRHR